MFSASKLQSIIWTSDISTVETFYGEALELVVALERIEESACALPALAGVWQAGYPLPLNEPVIKSPFNRIPD